MRIFLFLAILVSVISFSFSINKPFTLDEVEEARMAQKINEMGPKTFHPAPLGGGEDLSHPLLYSYTNAIFYKFFGSSEPALRSYGIMFYLLTLIVLILLIKECFKNDPEKERWALLIGTTLYLVNPLLIQHSVVQNGDNNISAFAIVLYAFLFYKFEAFPESQFLLTRVVLALVVAFNFMAKEVTPIFLMMSVGIYRLVQRDIKKFILDMVLNVGLGLALFWSLWSLYCVATNTDVMAFIKFTAMRKTKKVMTLGFFLKQFKYFFMIWKWPVYWVSAPFFVLVFIAYFERLKLFFRRFTLERNDFLFLGSAAMFTPYIFVKPSIDMMKYQYPVYPIFIFMIAALFAGHFPKRDLNGEGEQNEKKFSIFFWLVNIAGALWYLKAGDYILTLWRKMPVDFLLSYYLPIVVVMTAAYYIFKKAGFYKTFILAMLIMIYPVSIGLNMNQMASYTTAESWLNYGERGHKETAKYLKDNVKPGMEVVARKDIEYYLNYRYKAGVTVHEPTAFFQKTDPKDIVSFLKDNPIQFFVFDSISSLQKGNPEVIKLIAVYFTSDKKFGDFVVLKRK